MRTYVIAFYSIVKIKRSLGFAEQKSPYNNNWALRILKEFYYSETKNTGVRVNVIKTKKNLFSSFVA